MEGFEALLSRNYKDGRSSSESYISRLFMGLHNLLVRVWYFVRIICCIIKLDSVFVLQVALSSVPDYLPNQGRSLSRLLICYHSWDRIVQGESKRPM